MLIYTRSHDEKKFDGLDSKVDERYRDKEREREKDEK